MECRVQSCSNVSDAHKMCESHCRKWLSYIEPKKVFDTLEDLNQYTYVAPNDKGADWAFGDWAMGDFAGAGCKVSTCGKDHFSQGFCKTHYRRFFRKGSAELNANPHPSVCKVLGCDGKSRSKGYCNKHYQRLLHTGSTETVRETRSDCSVAGCNEPHLSKGYCSKHYRRVLKHGTTELQKEQVKTCSVETCQDKVHSKSLCTMHYQRLKRTGSTNEPVKKTVSVKSQRALDIEARKVSNRRKREARKRLVEDLDRLKWLKLETRTRNQVSLAQHKEQVAERKKKRAQLKLEKQQQAEKEKQERLQARYRLKEQRKKLKSDRPYERKAKPEKVLSDQDILGIYRSNEPYKAIAAEYEVTTMRVHSIKFGLLHDDVTKFSSSNVVIELKDLDESLKLMIKYSSSTIEDLATTFNLSNDLVEQIINA